MFLTITERGLKIGKECNRPVVKRLWKQKEMIRKTQPAPQLRLAVSRQYCMSRKMAPWLSASAIDSLLDWRRASHPDQRNLTPSTKVTFPVHTACVPAPHIHSHYYQCRTPYAAVHTLVLLMMGIMMPETCWDKSLIINIKLVASCWFLSLHPTFMMHGHKSLK